MKKLMLLLAGILALGAVSARATLIGQVITATDPGEGLNKTATLDGSVQFKDNGQTLGFAFGDDTLTVTNLFDFNSNWAGFGPLTFSGFTTPITGITLASNNGFSGTILSPTFTSTSIIFNMSSGSAAGGSAKLVFNINTESPSVPENGATGVMFGSVMLGLATLARKGLLRGLTVKG